MAAGRTTLLILVSLTGVGIALVLTFTLVPKLFADMSSSAIEQEEQMRIESTKELPEVREFLHFYPNATAEIDYSSNAKTVKYSFEKFHKKKFSEVARLYISLERQITMSYNTIISISDKPYSVRMDCAAISYFDIENSNIDSHGVVFATGYGNVTKFVTDTGCAR